jgi:hypothetical protein
LSVPQLKASRGPSSLNEEARLTGKFDDWHNLSHMAVWLTGGVSIAAVRDAWRRLCLRHDVERRTHLSPDEACTRDDALSEVEVHAAESDEEAIAMMRALPGNSLPSRPPGILTHRHRAAQRRRHLLGVSMDDIISDVASWNVRVYIRALCADATSRVHAFSKQARVTPFTVIPSSVLAGMQEVVDERPVGISVNQRDRMLPGTAEIAGPFVQTASLHLERRSTSWLETVQEVFRRADDFFEYSLPLLVAGRSWNEAAQRFVLPELHSARTGVGIAHR